MKRNAITGAQGRAGIAGAQAPATAPPRTVFELFVRTTQWLAQSGCFSYAAELRADLPPNQDIAGVFEIADRCVRLPMATIQRLQALLDRSAEQVVLPAAVLGDDLQALRAFLHEMWHAQGPGEMGAMYADAPNLDMPWGHAFGEGLTHHTTLATEYGFLEAMGLTSAQPGLLAARPRFVYYTAQTAAVDAVLTGLMAPLGYDVPALSVALAGSGYAELPLTLLTRALIDAHCGPARSAIDAAADTARVAASIRTGFDRLASDVRRSPKDADALEVIGLRRGAAIVATVQTELRQVARRRPPAPRPSLQGGTRQQTGAPVQGVTGTPTQAPRRGRDPLQ